MFVPQLNGYAKVLILLQFHWMMRYFTMMHNFDSEKSYCATYFRKVRDEQKINDANWDNYIDQISYKYPEIADDNNWKPLSYLKRELTDSRQRSYCCEVINTMALHISNAIGDRVITNMLNNYIDKEVDICLS
jgi:hypothetical protein